MAGYNITFVPFAGGKPGTREVFADGFMGKPQIMRAERGGRAARRPRDGAGRLALRRRRREGESLADHV